MAASILSDLQKQALKLFVHSPAETTTSYVRFAEEIKAHPGIQFGCILDSALIPLRPGRMLGLLARSGHGKTSFGGAILLNEARRLQENNLTDRFYVAHVTWEQTVEELEAMYQDSTGYNVTDVAWGRVPLEQVRADSLKRPARPVWLFGESLYNTDFDSPPMTIEMVFAAIEAIYKQWNLLPSLLFIDYVQDIPVPSERDRYSQVSQAIRLTKRLGVQAKCPTITGVQANQRVDDNKTPIPAMRDTEWSAVIQHKADVLLSLWRPIRTFLPHEKPTINVAGVEYPNDDNLLVTKLLKQRWERGQGIWAVHFNPATLALRDYTLHKLDDNPIHL